MKTPEEIETLKESLRLPTAFAYQTATQRMALDYIEQLERKNKDLLEKHELNDFLRDKVKKLEAQVPKWISVAERLPEKNSESNGTWCSDTILATTAGYILFGYFYVYKYSGTWEFVCVDEDMDSDRCVTVTHWMPLPSRPKEE